MTAAEAAVFAAGPLVDMCVRMREIDEAAKVCRSIGFVCHKCNQVVGKTVPGFEAYQSLIEAALVHPPRAPEACKGSFVRDGNTLRGINELLLA